MSEFFDDFWTASELSALSRPAFGARLAEFEDSVPAVDPWSRPAGPVPAARLTGPLADLLARRRSARRFADRPLDEITLGRLLSSLTGQRAGRGYPSAGALYPVRTVTLLFAADRRSGRVIQHDPTAHTLTDAGACPGWADLLDDLAGYDAESPPAAVIGCFADPAAMLAKYGERGGRFLLIEAGAILQSLTLAAAHLGLVGYPLGGSDDRRMIDLAGLDPRSTRWLLGYAIGHRFEPPAMNPGSSRAADRHDGPA